MEIALVVHRLFASQQLEQNDAIAVDIRLLVEAGGARVLGINVANSAHDIGRRVSLWNTQTLRNAKVREVWLVIFVEEDILWFYIPVDYPGTAVMVKVGKALSSAESNPKASLPIEFFLLGLTF